jgi:hypothetical protein
MPDGPDTTFDVLDAPAAPGVVADPQATTDATVGADAPPAFTETDANAYRALADMGITPDTAAQFVQAKTQLEGLNYHLANNPRGLLLEMEKTNPELFQKFQDESASLYIERNPVPSDSAAAGKGSAPTSVRDPRVDAMENELTQLRNERSSAAASAQRSAVEGQYNSALKGLIEKLPAGLSEDERDYIRLKTNESIGKDSAALGRLNKGVFVDVPKHFKQAAEAVAAKRKSGASAQETARAAVAAGAHQEFTPAANPAGGVAKQPPAPGSMDDWDTGAAEMASALKSAK